jgi:hypothetical protein
VRHLGEIPIEDLVAGVARTAIGPRFAERRPPVVVSVVLRRDRDPIQGFGVGVRGSDRAD